MNSLSAKKRKKNSQGIEPIFQSLKSLSVRIVSNQNSTIFFQFIEIVAMHIAGQSSHALRGYYQFLLIFALFTVRTLCYLLFFFAHWKFIMPETINRILFYFFTLLYFFHFFFFSTEEWELILLFVFLFDISSGRLEVNIFYRMCHWNYIVGCYPFIFFNFYAGWILIEIDLYRILIMVMSSRGY